MALLLAADVIHDKWQISSTEGYNAESLLPGERDSPAQLLIEVVGTRTFQLPNPVADPQRRGNPDGQVDVILDASDFVEEGSPCRSDSTPQKSVNLSFNGSSQDRAVGLGVPAQVEIDLREDLRRHESCPRRDWYPCLQSQVTKTIGAMNLRSPGQRNPGFRDGK